MKFLMLYSNEDIYKKLLFKIQILELHPYPKILYLLLTFFKIVFHHWVHNFVINYEMLVLVFDSFYLSFIQGSIHFMNYLIFSLIFVLV